MADDSLLDVTGKVALITGATGGFGQMASETLSQAGAKVMMTGRSEEKLAPISERLQKEGGDVAHVAGRPDSLEDVAAVVGATVDQFGGLDILITAAGLNKVHPIVEFPVEEWEEVMNVNVKGTWLACREAGKVMIDQGRGGKVILLSSTRGEMGLANYTAYCPSKAAINLLTKTLACEWGAHSINVNAVAPTVFRTDLTQWMFDDQEFYKNILTRVPIGRLGEPEDFKPTVLFLSSAASDFMTGSIMYVDGGYAAG